MPLTVVTAPAIERLLSKLEGLKGGAGDQWTALCPAHEDHNASLSVKLAADGRILVNCHATCTALAIVTAIGLTMGDLFPDGSAPTAAAAVHPRAYSVERERPAEKRLSELGTVVAKYDYVDPAGAVLYQVWRYDPKDFRPHHLTESGRWAMGLNGIEPVLYRLPGLTEALDMDRRVFLVEGEKDADALVANGYPATTVSGGAKSWRPHHAKLFHGAQVIILPDNDDAGRSYATQAAADITAAGGTVRVVALPNLPPKGDVSDWLNAGGDLDDLADLIDRTPVWGADSIQPPSKNRWRLSELWANEAIMRPPPPVVPYLAWSSRTTLLAAREKSGKSTLTGFMAACVSRGRDFLGEPCERGRVLVIGLEEYIGDTARRLKEFDADGEMIELVTSFVDGPAARIAEMLRYLDEVDPRLVIIDSLIAYASGLVTDANNATQTQLVVQGIADLSHRSAAAFDIIHHARKVDGKYRDSSAIGGAVDVIAEIFAPEETEKSDPNRRRVRPVGRVPARSVDFRFTGTGYELVDPSGPERGPLDQRIVAIIKDRPNITASDVAEAVGERRQDVLTRITHMIAKGLLINDGDSRRTRLRLPTYAPASAFL